MQIPSTTVNGGIHTERKVGNRDRERNRIGSGESEHESLLVHENTPKFSRNNQLNLCSEQGNKSIQSVNYNFNCLCLKNQHLNNQVMID